jgi:formylglycine-generating enzyme required for sulfatase activity
MNAMRLALTTVLLSAVFCSRTSCSVSCDADLAVAARDDRDAGVEQMLFIRGGTSLLGDIIDKEVQYARPLHDVTMSSFYLNKREVTVEGFGLGNGQNIARSSEMNFNAAGGDFAFAEKGECSRNTVPVGSFRPNSLGLHDMSGNVWEWCSDFLGRYSGQSQTNPHQQKGMLGSRRAARGGPWFGDASFARVSARMGWVADDRCDNIGFRIARSK